MGGIAQKMAVMKQGTPQQSQLYPTAGPSQMAPPVVPAERQPAFSPETPAAPGTVPTARPPVFGLGTYKSNLYQAR